MEVDQRADWGDYLKVFACTAVMLQPILSLIIKGQPSAVQLNLGLLYDLVKYTAPAFIWGDPIHHHPYPRPKLAKPVIL